MQFKFTKFATALIVSGIVSLPLIAHANDSSELEELRALVQQLDQKIKVLDRKNELAEEAAAIRKQETPVITSNQDKYNSGFGIQSADGQNKIQFGGLVQLDNRQYPSANEGNTSGFDVRRIRPIVQGTLDGIYDFKFAPEYGDNKVASSSTNGGIADAFVNARFKPWLQVQAGKFAPDVGLERLESSNFNKFIELSTISNNFVPNRDIGVSLHGDIINNKLYYAVGLYQGVVDGGDSITSQSYNGNNEYSARVFATPFKGDDSVLAGLGFGIAATHDNGTGSDIASTSYASTGFVANSGLPGYKTPGQESTFFAYNATTSASGNRNRVTPQAYFYYGPFGVIAEYARVSQNVSGVLDGGSLTGARSSADLHNNAWEITGSWLLTGENATHNKPVSPNSPFSTNGGGWGAWELVARFQETNIDQNAYAYAAKGTSLTTSSVNTTTLANSSTAGIEAQSAKTWGLGVNWYLSKNLKLATNYEVTSFNSFAGQTGTTRPDEKFIDSRLQLAF